MTAPAMPMPSRPMRGRSSQVHGGIAAQAAPDATIYIMGVAAVFAIWRLQEIIPGFASLKLPVLSLLVGMMSFFATRPISALTGLFKNRIIQMVAALAALAIIGGPFAIVRGYALNFVIYDFTPTLLLCVFLAASIRSERDARWLLAFITLGGVVFSLWSRTHSYRDSSGRPGGIIYYDANDLALLVSTTAAVALGFAHTSKTMFNRALWMGSACVLLATVLWTISRGAFLAVCASAIYLLFSPIMPAAKRVVVMAVGAVGLVVVGGQSYINTMKTMLNPEDDYNFSGKSPNGRGEVWKRGRQYVWQRPFMGAGVRNYTAAEARSDFAMARAQINKGYKLSRAHNSYLEVAVEMGLPGFLLFTAVVLRGLWDLHVRSRKKNIAPDSRKLFAYLAAGLAGFSVGAFFLSGQYWALLYAYIGIVVALTNRPVDRLAQVARPPVLAARRRGASPAPSRTTVPAAAGHA